MTDGHSNRVRVDRRTTIRWLAATMVAANAGCSSNARFMGEEIPPVPEDADPLLGAARTPDGVGYGTDPDLGNPVIPWSRTMTAAQLAASATLCDHILPADEHSPAASALGVHEFIDEWISAPYPQQQSDRETILAGLEWLERQSRIRFTDSFASTTEEQAIELIAIAADQTTNSDAPASFFERFRFLAVGAFYTTETGMRDIGYIGNLPVSGDYPGPSEEAMAHLASVLRKLGLSLPT